MNTNTTAHLRGLARQHGLSYSCVSHRLERGWPLDKALATPPDQRRRCRNELHKNDALRDAIVKALGAVPEAMTAAEREAVQLVFVEGLGMNAAAQQLGVPYGCLYERVAKVRRLCAWLAQQGA